MSTPILATKLYIPPPRSKIVFRPRLVERLNEGLAANCKLTIISAGAGFGKTTLVSQWIAGGERPTAWLSLDQGDNDPARFLAYLVAALQTVMPAIGEGVWGILQATLPQPPPIESLLTTLLNEITTLPGSFVLVLDDSHVLDSQAVDKALTFLVAHLPPQLHLVIATREDPALPLAALRVRGQLLELRAADLRFTTSEAAAFLNQVMDLDLSAEDIAALERRTEGWIAGLQLAALSMQGHEDTSNFIKSFTGSHHFILDYLVEEVLVRQSKNVQTFLLRTSILERMCGSLCEAVVLDPSASGQETLEYLEHANIFIVPLDDERQWYRYHHLFAELLRQRLQHSEGTAEYHKRASAWYEDNGLYIEAFQHAVAANDVERAERLMEGKGMPLHSRGAVNAILAWLASLPESVLDARPLLRVRSATMALTAGQTSGVEEKIEAAEKALNNVELNPQTRDLIGQTACARATLALTRYQPDVMMFQARRALEYLLPENLRYRFTANWALCGAYQMQGDRAAARQALTEALAISQASASVSMFSRILAITQLGLLQEFDNQLYLAAETFRSALPLLGEYPQPNSALMHLGLARIYYEWNDLETAEQHGRQSLQLARQFDRAIDRFIVSEVFLASLKLAQGDVEGAALQLADAEQSAHRQNFLQRLPDIAAAQVPVLLQQGDLTTAAQLAQTHDLPLSQARIYLAQGSSAQALALLEPLRLKVEAKNWKDEQLKVIVLQSVAHHAQDQKEMAVQLLGEALAKAELGGFIRIFVDLGEPMRSLLLDFRLWIEKRAFAGPKPIAYVDKLLAAFAPIEPQKQSKAGSQNSTLVEPLSPRELEILKLIAMGLSNREIGARLFLALDTVKGHNRRIFDKLQVRSRTEATARARELGLL